MISKTHSSWVVSWVAPCACKLRGPPLHIFPATLGIETWRNFSMEELAQLKKDIAEARIEIAKLNMLVLSLWVLASKNDPKMARSYEIIAKVTMEEEIKRFEKDHPEVDLYFFPPEKPNR